MPLDKEIHLGFIGPDACFDALKALGLEAFDDDGKPIQSANDLRKNGFLVEIDETQVQDLLKDTYLAITARLGWSFVGGGQRSDFQFDTPFGKRFTNCFSLHFQHDPGEVGDEPDDITFGVNLSARYREIILDVPSGSLGTIIDMEEMLPLAQMCREEMSKRFPAFSQSRIFVRDIFY
jgi:hypothetical protein